jgi:hypothetical protein
MTKNQKFTNFNTLGTYISKTKKEIFDNAIVRLKKENIFIENLSTLNKEQLKNIVPVDKYEHLDDLFDNRHNIFYKELFVNTSIWSTGLDSLSVVYEATIEPTGETLLLTAAFTIYNNGLPRDLEIDISDIYLKDSFKQSYSVNTYTDVDLKVVDFYNKLLGDMLDVNNTLRHSVQKRGSVIFSDVFKYVIYYSFTFNEKVEYRRINFVRKVLKTPDNKFASKLKDFMEVEYTLPVLGKKIDDMVDDDITVFKMMYI